LLAFVFSLMRLLEKDEQVSGLNGIGSMNESYLQNNNNLN
jgi:hypothetical protein